jgi:hypothetical protein
MIFRSTLAATAMLSLHPAAAQEHRFFAIFERAGN